MLEAIAGYTFFGGCVVVVGFIGLVLYAPKQRDTSNNDSER